jgi:hypothetical protein
LPALPAFTGADDNPSAHAMNYATGFHSNLGVVVPNSVKNEVLGVKIITTGCSNPLILKRLAFTSSGTTSLSDVENARVYYTGNDSTFSTTTQFGSTLNTKPTPFRSSGSQALLAGPLFLAGL